MTICFPVKRNDGLGSQIFQHFGLAPMFLLVDAKTGEVEEQTNQIIRIFMIQGGQKHIYISKFQRYSKNVSKG